MDEEKVFRLTRDVALLVAAVCVAAIPLSVIGGGHGGVSQFIRAHAVGDRDPFVKRRSVPIPVPDEGRSYERAYREDLGAEPDPALVAQAATAEYGGFSWMAEEDREHIRYRCSAGQPILVDGKPFYLTAAHCVPSNPIDEAPYPGDLFGDDSYALNSYAVAPHNYEEEGGGPYTSEYAAKTGKALVGPIGNDVAVTSLPQEHRPPFRATKFGSPNIGDRLCYHGATSGWVCGDTIGRNNSGWQKPIGLWDVKMHSMPGDSGSVVYRGDVAVGILSYRMSNDQGETRFTAISDLGDALRHIGREHEVALR